MSKLSRFTASDFETSPIQKFVGNLQNKVVSLAEAASRANKRLDEFEKSCARVITWGDMKAFYDPSIIQPDIVATHTALIFNIEPINQAVTKDEIVKKLRQFEMIFTVESGISGQQKTRMESKSDIGMIDLADRIEKFGVR